MAADPRQHLGRTGEDLALAHLERLGYELVARNHRTRWGEIDLIVRDGATLVFVEVKTRAGRRFGDAAEAVTPLKQLRMARLASEYVVRQGLPECACRFDVVAIHFDATDERTVDIQVIQNAFDA